MTGSLDTPTTLPAAVPARCRLPNRREHELVAFDHNGRRYMAGLGRFTDGALAELFLNSAKTGTDVATTDQDAAVVVSLALQFGCPAETIRRALARNPDGSARGCVGALLDLIAPAEAESELPDVDGS